MTGQERREEIIRQMRENGDPVAGKTLAADFGVSRQVIVQDIALLRAAGYHIISTNRGYVLSRPSSVSRVLKVHHTDDQVEEELYAVVDLGGRIKNVMVNHKVYGHLEAELQINSRRDARKFIEDIRSGKSSPLKNITSNYHYHTVEADSEEILDMIEDTLAARGFLVPQEG